MKMQTGNKERVLDVGRFSYACFKISHSTTHTEAGQKQDTFMHVHSSGHAVVDLYTVYLSMIVFLNVTILNS